MKLSGLFIGLLAGAFGGLVGLGGGVLAVPLMNAFLGLTQHSAVATSLVMVVFTGMVGALTYALENRVDWLGAFLIVPTAMLTAGWGARYAHRLAEWRLKRVFGWYLVLVALSLILKPYIPHVSEPLDGGLRLVLLALTGAAAGFASGLLGVGGGTIIVPILVLGLGLEQHTAQGTSLLAMVPPAVVGSYTHFRHGYLAQAHLPGLVLGILLGAFLGGTVANQLPEFWLRLVFAGVLVWTAGRYLGAKPRPQAA
ncbi:sulfite exporter TauE/SafE family protein [Meiothermus sp. QL-1]|uniref:sulfite exporter TauE/SafE family protein n=1 Tax=Meiothermus sp. QL-1 TaxID=2058095 RepID=UPI000E0C8C05|nr:sulfite exporter TauE/SafE family protein [Meiothermus sp. QL-1]RDI96459.1 sulfite exporter TauE/SafE family protein [Meiothermus sp. QL-1]